MKQFFIFLFILVCMLAMTNCDNGNVANLKNEIHEINRASHIELGIFGKLKKVSFEKKDTTVIFAITVEDKIVGSILRKEDINVLRNQYLNLMIYSNFSNLLDAIIGANASMKFCIILLEYNETIKFDIPSDFISARLDHKYSENEKERLLVENKVSIENANCPVRIDYGLKRTQVAIVDEYLIYYFELDEGIYDIEKIRSNINEIREDIIKRKILWEESDFRRMNRLGLGFMYRYYGNANRHFVDVVFTPEELSTILNEGKESYFGQI